jgi:hypothetical protein
MARWYEDAYDELLGAGDTALTLGSSILAEPLSGWAGILAGGDADAVREAQEALQWNPRTSEAVRNLGLLGEGVQAIADYQPPLSSSTLGEQAQAVGDYWRDTSVPALQETFGEEAGSGIGALGVGVLGSVGLPARGTRAFRQYGLDDLVPNDGPTLALPNPATNRKKGAVDRAAAWEALDKSERNAGTKRSAKTGQYVGAAPGIQSPQKRTAIVNKYDERTQRAIDAGIDPDYFYGEGRKALERVTDSPAEHDLVSQLYGPTSTQVGPRSNTDYVIRALDQNAMGVPTSVTLYPNSLRPRVDSVLGGEDPWKGYKVDRYGYLLGPKSPSAHPQQGKPPNDQWEGYGTGGPRGKVPSGAAQVAWADDIRGRALDKTNARRVAAGDDPLNLEQSQALHWAAIRAEAEGRPLQINPNDTLQGSLPQFGVQHAWEAEPGPTSGIGRLTSKQDYADEVAGVVLDDQGKDRIIRAMGGRLQEPALRGSGVWEGEINPGFQSRSFGSHTQARGMEAPSAARIDATEAVRQYMLGQEGRAYSQVQQGGKAKDYDIADILTDDGIPSPEQTAVLQGRLGDRGIVAPTEGGYRVLGTGPQGGDFMGMIDNLPGTPTFGRNTGSYAEMDWAGGRATEGLLGALDESGMPGPARLADSPQTRQMAGDIADMYKRLESQGKLDPNQKLTRALEAWQTGGLDALRKLVERGLAPAVVLSLFAGGSDNEPSSEPDLG